MIICSPYSDVVWTFWRLQSPVTKLFVQAIFRLVKIEMDIEAQHCSPFKPMTNVLQLQKATDY